MIQWNFLVRFFTYLSQAPFKEPGADSGSPGIFRSGADALGSRRKFGNLNRTAWLIAGMSALLLFRELAPQAAAQSPAPGDERGRSATQVVPGGLPDEVIILNNASDIGEFWKKLKQPDLILIKPGTSGGNPAVPAPGPGATATPGPRSHVVGSVKVRGRVEDDLADLTVELELSLLVQGAAWVPLGIDSQIVSSAREGERELELRVTGEGKWEARIEGQGPHRLRLDLKRPVKVSPDRKRLELAIPEAPSTYLELDVPRAVHDVELGSGESIGKTLLPGGKGTRLSAHLAPRSSLALDWSDEANSGPAPPPLLAAQVEIAINADAESVITQLVVGHPVRAGHGPQAGNPARCAGRGLEAQAGRPVPRG